MTKYINSLPLLTAEVSFIISGDTIPEGVADSDVCECALLNKVRYDSRRGE